MGHILCSALQQGFNHSNVNHKNDNVDSEKFGLFGPSRAIFIMLAAENGQKDKIEISIWYV